MGAAQLVCGQLTMLRGFCQRMSRRSHDDEFVFQPGEYLDVGFVQGPSISPMSAAKSLTAVTTFSVLPICSSTRARGWLSRNRANKAGSK